MVKVVVLKAGGAGRGRSLDCATICAAFTPPIEFGSHSEMVSTLRGYQAEHIVPTSAFHKKGRKGPKMPGCDDYSTPQGLTWMAFDGQTAKKEHKILTDQMRLFSKKNDGAGKQASLKGWLDEYEKGAKNALDKAKPQRKIKDDSHDPDSLRAAAAKCIREHAAEAFRAMPVAMNTKLRNPWKASRAPAARGRVRRRSR